jgi:hypothetical protein
LKFGPAKSQENSSSAVASQVDSDSGPRTLPFPELQAPKTLEHNSEQNDALVENSSVHSPEPCETSEVSEAVDSEGAANSMSVLFTIAFYIRFALATLTSIKPLNY